MTTGQAGQAVQTGRGRWVRVGNPGEVEVAALEMVGATSKDGCSTIGKFGSGFKYAVAAQCRMGRPPIVCVGRRRMDFEVVEVGIGKGVTVGRVHTRVDGTLTPRDWTTEMGRHDWADRPSAGLTLEWMALREIYCNALDENCLPEVAVVEEVVCREGWTYVYLPATSTLVSLCENIAEWIDPMRPYGVGRLTASEEGGRIFYRGVYTGRFKTLSYDYNFPKLEISESRTVSEWSLRTAIGRMLPSCTPEEVCRVMRAAKDNLNSTEAQLSSYDLKPRGAPEPEFAKTCLDAWTAVAGVKAVPYSTPLDSHSESLLKAEGWNPTLMPGGWAELVNVCQGFTVGTLLDEVRSSTVQKCRDYKEPTNQLAAIVECMLPSVLKIVGYSEADYTDVPKVRYSDLGGNVLGVYDADGHTVVVALDHTWNRKELAKTLVEEFSHAKSGAADCSRQFQDFLVRRLATRVRSQRPPTAG